MTADNEVLPFDPTGRRGRLRRSLSDPRLADPTANPVGFGQAAYRSAVAFGYCRMLDVPSGRLGEPLPEPITVAAARRLAVELGRWVRDPGEEPTPDQVRGDADGWGTPATALLDEWLDAPNPDEADAVAGRWVTRRTDVMAAMIALTEADHHIRAERPDHTMLSDAIDAVRRGPLNHLDAILEGVRVREVLGTVVHSTPVANLRDMLAGPYRERLPWWLDPAALPTGLVWEGGESEAEPESADPGGVVPSGANEPSKKRYSTFDRSAEKSLAAKTGRAQLSGRDQHFRKKDGTAQVTIAPPSAGGSVYGVLARDADGEAAPIREPIRVVAIDPDTGAELGAVRSPDDGAGGWTLFTFKAGEITPRPSTEPLCITVVSGNPEQEWEPVQ